MGTSIPKPCRSVRSRAGSGRPSATRSSPNRWIGPMPEPIYILGGNQTDFARTWAREGQDISDMVRTATQAAISASAIDPSESQSIHVGNAFGELQRQQAHLGSMVAQVMPELWGVPAMRPEGACASSRLRD